jgi:hypothetical protein
MVAFNSAAGNGKEVPEVVEANLYLESATFVTSKTLHVDRGARRSLRPRCVGPEHAAHHLVRSGQRMPVPSKELGLGAERGRRLPSDGACT